MTNNPVQAKRQQPGVSSLGPILTCMADVKPQSINWLWPNRIPTGRLTLLIGMPGVGKSFLTCDIASRVSKGMSWPDGSTCPRGSVILISAEDDPNDTIRPRLDAHLADVNSIHLMTTVLRPGEFGTEIECSFTLADIDALEDALQQVQDCKLVVVDPIGSFLGQSIDAHRENEVRAALSPIAELAEKYGTAVLMIVHRRKSQSSFADDMAMGSRAFTAVARSVWHLSADPRDRDRRLLLPGKCNLSVEPNGLAFAITGKPAAIEWEDDPVEITADEALAWQNETGGETSALDEAVAWLRNALASAPIPSKELKEKAETEGISRRVLEKARTRIGVTTGPDGFGGVWVWQLPSSSSVATEFTDFTSDLTLANSGDTGALSEDEGNREQFGQDD